MYNEIKRKFVTITNQSYNNRPIEAQKYIYESDKYIKHLLKRSKKIIRKNMSKNDLNIRDNEVIENDEIK